jgi:CheY-like chemotaxis protein
VSENLSPHKKASVLVADENAFNRNIVSDILRGAGMERLLFAHDGAEMLQLTTQFRPDIVIANSRLPKLSGLEFTRKIRAGHGEVNRAMSIIIATNTATGTFLENARASGVDEMLVRPFTAAALLARIEAVLIRPRRFIDGLNYVGPCRRRRMLQDYGGPMRRFSDPMAPVGSALWEAAANRDLMHRCVSNIAEVADNLQPGDRRRVRELFNAVEEADQLAQDVRDDMMAAAAKSLGRYITAIGASRGLERDAISTHIEAMQSLCAMTSAEDAAREELITGLHAVVDKRLGRKPAAA